MPQGVYPEIVAVRMVAFFLKNQLRQEATSCKETAGENVAPPGGLGRVAVAALLTLVAPVEEDDHQTNDDRSRVEPAGETIEVRADCEAEHADSVEEGDPAVGQVSHTEHCCPNLKEM